MSQRGSRSEAWLRAIGARLKVAQVVQASVCNGTAFVITIV